MINKKNIYNFEKTKNFFKEYPIVLIYQHNNLTVKQRIDLKIQLESLNNVKTLTVKNSIVDRVCCYLYNKRHRNNCVHSEISNSSNPFQKNQSLSVPKTKVFEKERNGPTSVSPKKPEFFCKATESNAIEWKGQDKRITNQLQNLLQGPVILLGCQNLEDVQKIWGILKTSPSFLFLGSQFNNQIYTHLDIQKSLEINTTIYYEFLNIFDKQLSFPNTLDYTHFVSNAFGCKDLFLLLSILSKK